MSDQNLGFKNPDTIDKRMDTETFTAYDGNSVHRERVLITGAESTTAARVTSEEPATTDYGVVVKDPYNSITAARLLNTLDVKQVSGANWSVSVTDIFGSVGTNVINPDGRIKVELPTGSSGLTDSELRASSVPVSQASGAQWSVNVVDVFATTTTSNVVNPDNRVKVELPAAIPVTQSGTWDEVGINDSGNSITVDNAALSVTGGGVEASALRVTIANDSTGVLSIDDNGGAITVDGSVAVTNAGTFAVQEDGAALTALQLLDNIVRAEDDASAGGHSGAVVLARRTDTPANQSGTDGDYEFLQVSAGRLWASAIVTAISAGDNNIGNVDIVTMPNITLAAGTNTNEVVGDVAQDAAVAGNPVLIGNRASTAIPTAMSADGDSVYAWSDRNGAGVVKHRPTATATLSNVAGSASSVAILASNTSRLGAMLHNDSTAVLYIKYGSTASTTSYTYKLQPGDHWEMPTYPTYTGAIDGIWASATGTARITEIT